MFTGIIQTLAKVKEIRPNNKGQSLIIEDSNYSDLQLGESIAINGVCQTVDQIIDKKSGTFGVFTVPETLTVTTLGSLDIGLFVNLERSLTLADRLGGHIILGHVEGKAKIAQIESSRKYWNIFLEYDSPYLVPKGSVSLDGISLTIHYSQGNKFQVQIIPETLKRTNISHWVVGGEVNIECDYLVKAIAHVKRYHPLN